MALAQSPSWSAGKHRGGQGQEEWQRDGQTDRQKLPPFLFVCLFLFFIYRFLQKNKSKKFFSIMSL